MDPNCVTGEFPSTINEGFLSICYQILIAGAATPTLKEISGYREIERRDQNLRTADWNVPTIVQNLGRIDSNIATMDQVLGEIDWNVTTIAKNLGTIDRNDTTVNQNLGTSDRNVPEIDRSLSDGLYEMSFDYLPMRIRGALLIIQAGYYPVLALIGVSGKSPSPNHYYISYFKCVNALVNYIIERLNPCSSAPVTNGSLYPMALHRSG
ncbi:hypothetical protein scyTo_0026271 [Scyliorhinus torazame]|uniref:Uncharacterized protein n=1 Tax=Scyliorhinus torazame TaxID=75743 RepID=A0A401QJS0_SCYTO|nr:hypothetical protein [Scyliorhinus torazame]